MVGVHVTFKELIVTEAHFKVAVTPNWTAAQTIDCFVHDFTGAILEKKCIAL